VWPIVVVCSSRHVEIKVGDSGHSAVGGGRGRVLCGRTVRTVPSSSASPPMVTSSFAIPATITRVSSRVAGEPSDARADSAQCAVRDMNPADHHSHSIHQGRGRVCVCVCVDTCQNAHTADLTSAEHVSACVSYDQAMARSYRRSPPLPLPPPSMR
jgi:hypothetical protein